MDSKKMVATVEKCEEKASLPQNTDKSQGKVVAGSGVPAVFEEVVDAAGSSVVTDELFHP